MKTETAFASLSLLGILLRIAHIPGSNILLVVSMCGLALLYFPFAFYFFPTNGIKAQKAGLSLALGFFLSNLVCGTLFLLMHWPGGFVVSMVAFLTVAILLFVTLSMQKSNKDETLKPYFRNLVMRTVVLMTVSFLVVAVTRLT